MQLLAGFSVICSQTHADFVQSVIKGSGVLQVAHPRMWNWQGERDRELGSDDP